MAISDVSSSVRSCLMLVRILGCLAAAFLVTASPAYGQRLESAPPRRGSVEQLLPVLERSPHAGTTLDRIYQHFTDNGGLETLVKGYRERIEANPQDVP